MLKSLTVWITPFTGLHSADEAIAQAQAMASSIGATPNLLLPTHYGQWPQAQCTQSIPADLLVGSPDDVGPIREKIESAGVGFGCWGVPVDLNSPELASGFAVAGGYYCANFEPDGFWIPGDDPDSIDAWWSRFWNAMSDQSVMDGNVSATIVPNSWGLGAFQNSLPNLAAGCNALAAEVYGGLQTQGSYPKPNLWPSQSFQLIRDAGVDANLIPILAVANLQSQASLANRLGHGNIHAWCI
jgi:hypothetical protein